MFFQCDGFLVVSIEFTVNKILVTKSNLLAIMKILNICHWRLYKARRKKFQSKVEINKEIDKKDRNFFEI